MIGTKECWSKQNALDIVGKDEDGIDEKY